MRIVCLSGNTNLIDLSFINSDITAGILLLLNRRKYTRITIWIKYPLRFELFSMKYFFYDTCFFFCVYII